ncbi:SDR family oxidoreductase [Pseudonocardia alaniniphila]|uniref:SDR family oxidoreductase n=1 Tax=Pseudonocardia alaniniphila TaxID=75291 RepID=UPI002402C596|nr:SDR family oxidoreductase [Pseudonocardia alaniniphila]
MRSYANILAPHSIRVNSVHPSGVKTAMLTAASMTAFLEANPQIAAGFAATPMPIDLLDSRDVSNAVLYLVSDEGRYVTGTTLPIDGGRTNKN